MCLGYGAWEAVSRFTTSKNAGTHYNAVFTREFVNACFLGLALVARSTMLVGVVEDVKVVAINAFVKKGIGDEFHE